MKENLRYIAVLQVFAEKLPCTLEKISGTWYNTSILSERKFDKCLKYVNHAAKSTRANFASTAATATLTSK